MLKVFESMVEVARMVPEETERRVAVVAKQPADAFTTRSLALWAAIMVVVDMPRTLPARFGSPTDCAAPRLGREQGIEAFRSEAEPTKGNATRLSSEVKIRIPLPPAPSVFGLLAGILLPPPSLVFGRRHPPPHGCFPRKGVAIEAHLASVLATHSEGGVPGQEVRAPLHDAYGPCLTHAAHSFTKEPQ
jgi:hypothetical protein